MHFIGYTSDEAQAAAVVCPVGMQLCPVHSMNWFGVPFACSVIVWRANQAVSPPIMSLLKPSGAHYTESNTVHMGRPAPEAPDSSDKA
jgi:hypothetical protein